MTFRRLALATALRRSATRFAPSSVENTRPVGPTRWARLTVNFPLPAPTSATVMPGFSSNSSAICAASASNFEAPLSHAAEAAAHTTTAKSTTAKDHFAFGLEGGSMNIFLTTGLSVARMCRPRSQWPEQTYLQMHVGRSFVFSANGLVPFQINLAHTYQVI